MTRRRSLATVRVREVDLALSGCAAASETLAVAFRPIPPAGGPLPHGVGVVQTYGGQTIVWQFGAAENGSSSLVVTMPGPGLTLIMLGNSNGLVKPFPLAAGDVTASPFAKVFLGLFIR